MSSTVRAGMPPPGALDAVRKALAAGRVVVIMPAFNEEESIGPTIARIRAELPGVSIVVISDCSTDRTAEVARAAGAHVVEHPCNLGYGGAVQTGFRYALKQGYDYLVQIDADGQHDPASAMALLGAVVGGEADVAIGSRFLGRADYHIPAPRRIGMAVFGAIVTFVTRQSFSDPTSGYQAMNARVLRFFAFDNYPSDFPDADTIILLALAGFRVVEVPVVMKPRLAGSSMHSNLRAFYYVSKMMLSIFMVLLRRKMLRVREKPLPR
jgi:glycosyltransferase involved in cell wall biosynthesis